MQLLRFQQLTKREPPTQGAQFVTYRPYFTTFALRLLQKRVRLAEVAALLANSAKVAGAAVRAVDPSLNASARAELGVALNAGQFYSAAATRYVRRFHRTHGIDRVFNTRG